MLNALINISLHGLFPRLFIKTIPLDGNENTFPFRFENLLLPIIQMT